MFKGNSKSSYRARSWIWEKVRKEIEDKACGFLKARNLNFMFVNNEVLTASDQAVIWSVTSGYPGKHVRRDLEEKETGCTRLS